MKALEPGFRHLKFPLSLHTSCFQLERCLCRPSNQEPKNPKPSDWGLLCKQLVPKTQHHGRDWFGRDLLNTFNSGGLSQPKGSWAGASLPYMVSVNISSLTGFRARLLMIYIINRDSSFLKIPVSIHILIQNFPAELIVLSPSSDSKKVLH